MHEVERVNSFMSLYTSAPFNASLSMFITLVFHVILNFQSTKIILALNIFNIFTLTTRFI